MQSSQGCHLDCAGLRSIPGSVGAAICSFAIIIVASLALSSCSAPPAPPVATVSVNSRQLGVRIPKNFLGFSNEVSTAGMGLPTPTSEARGSIVRLSGVPTDAQLAYVLGEPSAPNTGCATFS